jgi:hypothetical protein
MTDVPEELLALLPVVAAFGLVAARGGWRIVRTVVTIAHEGGHVGVALLAGRRLTGMRVHSDASGVTVSRGRATGPGMVATLLAGYTAPSILGVVAALLIAAGQHQLILALTVAALVALLMTVRNLFGVVAILVTGAVLVFAGFYATEPVRQAGAALLAWVLLFGGIRSVGDLRRARRRTWARDSDADQLARLTRVPAAVWVVAFGVIAVGALVGATALLVTA